MNYQEKKKLKDEITIAIYNNLIQDIMSNVDNYDDLPASIKLQLNIAMRKSKYIVDNVD
jgi:hypothetical protein